MQEVKRRKSRKPESFTISFRVGPAHLSELEKRASDYEMSVHEYARRLVVESLEDVERERVREEVSTVGKEVARLRGDMVTTLEMLLINLTKATEEDIHAWVTAHLGR